jgi:transposase-like protein
MVYLWRAVDHEGGSSTLTITRDKDAALTFAKALKHRITSNDRPPRQG